MFLKYKDEVINIFIMYVDWEKMSTILAKKVAVAMYLLFCHKQLSDAIKNIIVTWCFDQC